jgi:5-aminolevulinate synthase
MQVTSLLRFSNVCPFLGSAGPNTLRTLAKTHGVSNMSSLTARAMSCPMMGPQLAAIGQARAYAHVAGNKDIADMHNVSQTGEISRSGGM